MYLNLTNSLEFEIIACFHFHLLFSALSIGGSRVLNANRQATRRAEFSAAGVTWQYRRRTDRLSASGTLTESAVVEVYVGSNGNNVQFTYEYVVDAPTTEHTTQTPTTTQAPTTTPPPLPTSNSPTCGSECYPHISAGTMYVCMYVHINVRAPVINCN